MLSGYWVFQRDDQSGSYLCAARRVGDLGGLLWTKGPAATTVNPANQGGNFTNAGDFTISSHIANNDSDEAPLDINLTGTGMAVMEAPSIVTHPKSVGIVSGQTATMTADGLSTSLFVLGPEEGMKKIESRQDAAALFIIREKDGTFRQSASSRFGEFTGYQPAPDK